MGAQPLHRLSDKGFKKCKQFGNLEFGVIDVDEDADCPILVLGDHDGSHVVFPRPSETERIRILWVKAQGQHSMSEMVDKLVEMYGRNDIRFFNVISKKLKRKIRDGEYGETETPRGDADYIDCEWEVA